MEDRAVTPVSAILKETGEPSAAQHATLAVGVPDMYHYFTAPISADRNSREMRGFECEKADRPRCLAVEAAIRL